ncbi:hypothetical protein Tco_1148929, partial [Tanacetum coccineum]
LVYPEIWRKDEGMRMCSWLKQREGKGVYKSDLRLMNLMWMMSDSNLITRPTPIEFEGLKLVSEDSDLGKEEVVDKTRFYEKLKSKATKCFAQSHKF